MSMPETGEKAPAFAATTHEGRKISLDDFRGQHVVLWFYPRANTSG